MAIARGTDMARVIQVIETSALAGEGTSDDPARIVKQYWSMEGEILAVDDPHFAGRIGERPVVVRRHTVSP